MFYKLPLNNSIKVITAYDITRQTTWHCADENNITVIILEGKCSFTIDNSTHILSAGDMILIPANEEYMRKPVENSSCSFAYIHFSVPIMPIEKSEYESCLKELSSDYFENKEPLNEIVLPKIINIFKKPDKFISIFTELKKGLIAGNRIGLHSASLYFTEILFLVEKAVLLSFNNGDSSPLQVRSPILKKSVSYIRRHYEEKITLADLCNECFVTPQHLIRTFKKELGISPIEYINKVKIMHAIDLLRTSNLTVEEIAYKLGFSSPGYFGRVFKKLNGNSPQKERERIVNFRS